MIAVEVFKNHFYFKITLRKQKKLLIILNLNSSVQVFLIFLEVRIIYFCDSFPYGACLSLPLFFPQGSLFLSLSPLSSKGPSFAVSCLLSPFFPMVHLQKK